LTDKKSVTPISVDSTHMVIVPNPSRGMAVSGVLSFMALDRATCEVSISVKSGDPFVGNAVLICCIVIALVAIDAIAVFLIRRKGN